MPKLKHGEEEPYRIRRAVEADLTWIAVLYGRAVERHMIACVRTPAIFKYELDGQSENNADHHIMFVIEERSGEPVGYFQHPNCLGKTGVSALWYELKPGVSWLAVTPSVVRHLWNLGLEYAQRDGKTCTSFGFILGAQHPAYEALGANLPAVHPPYAWYLRVPDLAGFLDLIRPALERRLATSIAAGHSRGIKISFYRDGLKLVLERGRLATIEPWKPSPDRTKLVRGQSRWNGRRARSVEKRRHWRFPARFKFAVRCAILWSAVTSRTSFLRRHAAIFGDSVEQEGIAFGLQSRIA